MVYFYDRLNKCSNQSPHRRWTWNRPAKILNRKSLSRNITTASSSDARVRNDERLNQERRKQTSLNKLEHRLRKSKKKTGKLAFSEIIAFTETGERRDIPVTLSVKG